jgi:hypothetical protein
MAEYTYTPGPWMIFEGGDIGSASVRRPDTVVIRSGTVKGQTIGEAMANARLIAAAPELFEALRCVVVMAREIHEHWDKDRDSKVGKHLAALSGYLKGYRQDYDALHALIAKATGDPPP